MHFGQIGFWQTKQRSAACWPGCLRQGTGPSAGAGSSAAAAGAAAFAEPAIESRGAPRMVTTGAGAGATGAATAAMAMGCGAGETIGRGAGIATGMATAG